MAKLPSLGLAHWFQKKAQEYPLNSKISDWALSLVFDAYSTALTGLILIRAMPEVELVKFALLLSHKMEQKLQLVFL